MPYGWDTLYSILELRLVKKHNVKKGLNALSTNSYNLKNYRCMWVVNIIINQNRMFPFELRTCQGSGVSSRSETEFKFIYH